MALLQSEIRDGCKEDRSQRVMRASVVRGIVRSMESVAGGGSGLKWMGNGLGFIGMPGQGNSDVDSEVLNGPLRRNNSGVMAGVPVMRVFMSPEAVGFGEKGKGRELEGQVGHINSRLKGETLGRMMVLIKQEGSGGFTAMVPEKAEG